MCYITITTDDYSYQKNYKRQYFTVVNWSPSQNTITLLIRIIWFLCITLYHATFLFKVWLIRRNILYCQPDDAVFQRLKVFNFSLRHQCSWISIRFGRDWFFYRRWCHPMPLWLQFPYHFSDNCLLPRYSINNDISRETLVDRRRPFWKLRLWINDRNICNACIQIM